MTSAQMFITATIILYLLLLFICTGVLIWPPEQEKR